MDNIKKAIVRSGVKFGAERLEAMKPFIGDFDAGRHGRIPADVLADMKAFIDDNVEQLKAIHEEG